MILVLSDASNLVTSLLAKFAQLGVDCKQLSFQDPKYLEVFYTREFEVTAIIVDAHNPKFPQNAWFDLLDSLGRRIPILLISEKEKFNVTAHSGQAELVTWLIKPNAEEIVHCLDMHGAIGVTRRLFRRNTIPLYNQLLSVHMLQQNGALSILSVHASGFKKIAIEYGVDAYYKLQSCFQQLLYDLWGATGSFRGRDILFRSSPTSNTYYILLEQSRSRKNIPLPGSLERLADRLVVRLENLLWKELFKSKEERILPDFLTHIPKFSVGHATSLYNPCIDSMEIVNTLLETSREVSKVQERRMLDRHRELMQNLIKTDNLLVPHYQAVFKMKELTPEKIKGILSSHSLKGVDKAIYAFESLIRVNVDAFHAVMGQKTQTNIDVGYLRPDVMFTIAENVNLTLELDQACFKQALLNYANLPGKLMVNILPRNFYYIEILQTLIPKKMDVIFEVSETEAINNYALLRKAKSIVSKNKHGIAIDDFGKGHSGLDRIIQIKPEIIKLDRGLIEEIDKDTPKKAFVEGLVNAARISGSVVLAEGVETFEEFQALQKIGVDLIQGFFLHKPQPVNEIRRDLGLIQEDDENLGTVA